jgi:hypothetical protein
MTDNLIKVHVTLDPANCGGAGGESLWARQIHATAAKLDNIPFFATHLGLGDLVRIDDQGEVLEVLEWATHTRRATYPADGSPAAVRRRWAQVREHLASWDIHVEGMVPGVFSMAVPVDLTDEELEGILAACEVPLQLVG